MDRKRVAQGNRVTCLPSSLRDILCIVALSAVVGPASSKGAWRSYPSTIQVASLIGTTTAARIVATLYYLLSIPKNYCKGYDFENRGPNAMNQTAPSDSEFASQTMNNDSESLPRALRTRKELASTLFVLEIVGAICIMLQASFAPTSQVLQPYARLDHGHNTSLPDIPTSK